MENQNSNIVAASPLQKIVIWFELRKKKKAINNIRGHMLFFGLDVSDMTDQEIEEGVQKFAEISAKAGVTAKEAADGLSLVIKNGG